MEIYNDLMQIILFFIIYSFFGWILESMYKTIAQRKWVNSGFLYGPFCPIYGLGAMIMFIFLENYKDKPILLFVVAVIILSVWEYIVGWLLEKIFHAKYWDYSENKFNIHGRICLKNSIFWGILGLIFIHYIHPFIQTQTEKFDFNILLVTTIILGIYLIIDAIISIIKVKNIEIEISKFTEISDLIKEKLDELKKSKDNAQIKSMNIEIIQEKIEELKKQQHKLKIRLLRRTNRLKKAFPTMKSKKITGFLNEKIENIKNK